MRIKKRELEIDLIILALALFCVIIHKLEIASILSIVIVIVYFCALLKRNIFYYVKYFPLALGAVMAISGVFLCEFSNLSLYEIDEKAAFVGSLPLLVFSYIVFFVSLSMFEDRRIYKKAYRSSIRERSEKKYPKVCHYISIASTIVLFLQFIRIIRTPAFMMSLDRFQYSSMVYSNKGIWRLFDSVSYALIIFPAMDFIHNHKYVGGAGLLFYVLYNLWNGNKFGPFLTIIIFFLLIDYEKIVKMNRTQLRRLIVHGVIILLILMIVALILASNVMKMNWKEYLGLRLAQQGQLWWKTFSVSKASHLSELSDEWYGTLYGSPNVAENIGAKYGIYKIMYLCGKQSYIDFKIGAGSRFSEAGYATAFYYLRTLGCVLYSITNALIIAKTLDAFIGAVGKRYWIEIALLARLYTLERAAFSMATFGSFIDGVSILSYLLLGGLFVYHHRAQSKGVKLMNIYSGDLSA